MKPQLENGLKRKLGLFSTTNIVVANMIGAGIFTMSGLLMEDLKNPFLMIGLWIIAGIIALCGALSYGELGAAIPKAGGEYTFLSRLYHPLTGFLSGWTSFFVGFSAPVAASSIVFTEYLTRAFPRLLELGLMDGPIEAVLLKKACAIIIILIFTFIHSRGIESGAGVQNALTLLKVILIAGLVFFGFLLGKGNWAHFSQGDSFNFDFSGWKTIGLSLMWIMFAYSGWNASAYIGSEIKKPAKNLPRSLLLGTGIVIILYFCLNLFYVYGVPPAEMEGVISIGGLAAGKLFGRSLDSILSIMISLLLFSSLSAYIILGPRVFFQMARDGHFFSFAGEVHGKYGVPSKSIYLQGVLAVIMVLLGTFEQLLTYMGFSLGIFPILSVIGVFKLRMTRQSVYKLPGFPVAPLIFILTGVVILVLAYFQRPVESSIALLTVIMGIPVYYAFKGKI